MSSSGRSAATTVGNSVALEAIEDRALEAARSGSPRSCARRAAKRGGPHDEAPSAHGDRAPRGAAGFACSTASIRPRSSTAETICRVPEAGRTIALTYDDGPNPRHTEELMAVLERHGARATFLLIGKWAEREPGLLASLAEARARARQPHLVAPDDAAALADADPRGDAALPRGGRGRRG